MSTTAKRFKLVPEALWNRMRESHHAAAAAAEEPTSDANPALQTEMEIINSNESETDETLEKIVNELPKQCQRKARIIINYIGNSIKLDTNMRVQYPDATRGGHISGMRVRGSGAFSRS